MNRRLSESGPWPAPGPSVSRHGRSRTRDVSNTGGSTTVCTVSVCLADAMPDPITSISDPSTPISVVNNEAGHRYEAWLGGALAGVSVYTLDDGLITFTHTEVADAFEGKGVASRLIRAALDDVRVVGARKVRPLCPFVKAFVQRHADYQDLLDAQDRLT